MIVKTAQLERALSSPAPDWTLALFYGPDEAGSRAHADRFAATMGSEAERIDLDGATLKDDPARLPDEANAITMFGGPRWIRVTGGDEALKAVEALLDAPRGCPVVVVASNLPKTSALVKLAGADSRVLACQTWKPEGGAADAVVRQTGAAMGLRISGDAARMIADATTGDRALVHRELEKLSLYLDAEPGRPRPVERGDVEAIGAAIDLREPWTLVDALFDGRPAETAGEMNGDTMAEAIPTLRAVGRRALNIARAHAARRGGPGPRLNNRERESVERQARIWGPDAVAKAHSLTMESEAAIKAPRTAGDVIAAEAMFRLSRIGERRR